MQIVCLAIAILSADQLSKFIILKNLQPGQSLPIIKGIFHISLVCNRGFAFGLFSGLDLNYVWIVYICVVILILVNLFYKRHSTGQKSTQVYFTLILSGAVGNLIDRIRFGCVVDFLDFRIWPVFNIADSAITIGTILLLIQLLKRK
ncbi:signal peptidase II [Candidatus Omnitrophota bacterium]